MVPSSAGAYVLGASLGALLACGPQPALRPSEDARPRAVGPQRAQPALGSSEDARPRTVGSLRPLAPVPPASRARPPDAALAASGVPEATVAAELPAGIVPGEHSWVEVPGDRPLHVYQAPAAERRVVLYLHGYCGDTGAVAAWVDRALRWGTLIELVGDRPCHGRAGRFSWTEDVASILARIDAALERVAAVRGGLLDVEEVLLFGYSQGAARAEALAELAPSRFPRIVLGSPPEEPNPALLAESRGVAVLGGSREATTHWERGVAALKGAGVRARYFVLPGARHGEFGTRGPEVVEGALRWLMAGGGAS